MRKGFLTTMVILLSGLTASAAMAANEFQAPAANVLVLSCARTLYNGAIQHLGINQGCGYDIYYYQHVAVDWSTTAANVYVQWSNWQPAGSQVCVRARSYHSDGSNDFTGGWLCGNGAFAQNVPTPIGSITLEVGLRIFAGYSGLPAITSIQASN